MRCEVCGRKIYDEAYTVMIEGAKLTVCGKCEKHGKIVRDEPKLGATRTKTPVRRSRLRVKSKEQPRLVGESSLELVQNFDEKIREARIKLGLSHEELGRKIGEKVSVLKKIETGKMTPDNKLAAKLEHSLKIRLLVPISEEKTSQIEVPKSVSRELTLGDLIELNKKKVEKTK